MNRLHYTQRICTIIVSVLVLGLLSGCGQATPPLNTPLNQNSNLPGSTTIINTPVVTPIAPTILALPIDQGLTRVTLKTFGLYVSPGHSPVSPERFTGYHTGVDFETFPSEQATAVNIVAICTGKLLEKSWISGYGGVAIQACTLDGEAITVVYGHLKLASVTTKAGAQLTAGSTFAVLGKGGSQETDGERKHLHLGLHRGTAINVRGYVQKSTDLSQWIDALSYLK